MMRPTGSHSTYHALRGQTLELECIVQGLWVPACYRSHQSEDLICSLESIITATHLSLLHPPLYPPTILSIYFGVCWCLHMHLFFFPLFSIHSSLYSPFSPTPKVSWLRKDGEMSETRTSKDMFDRRLSFINISESDGGEYQCIAENSQGKTVHTYTVTVEGIYTHRDTYRLQVHQL